MARIRRADQQPAGVTVVEFLEIGGPYLEERMLPPVNHVLNEDFAVAISRTDDSVVLDCRGFESCGAAGLGFLVSLWRWCQRAGRRMVLCLGTQMMEFFGVTKMDKLIPCFADLPGAVVAARDNP